MPCKDLEKRKEYLRKYREQNKEKAKGYQRDWQAAHPESNREYYQKNREKLLQKAKARHKRDLNISRDYDRQWYHSNADRLKADPDYCNRMREKNWKKRGMDLTVEGYDKLLEKQNGKCAICKRTPKRRLNVDHNHKTGEIRGLLCIDCNTAIGKLQDDPKVLQVAIDYLNGLWR